MTKQIMALIRAKEEEIRSKHQRDFRLAELLLHEALDVDHPGIDISGTPFTPMTIWAATGLEAKACNTFRGIYTLAQAGLINDARILLRALMETFVAMNFILGPDLVLRKKEPAVSAKLRADLFWAHSRFEALRYLEARIDAGAQGLAQHLQEVQDAKLQATQIIGPVWTRVLETTPKTYSGLPLGTLMAAMDLESVYRQLYKEFSWAAHATDALVFAEPERSPEELSFKALLQPDDYELPNLLATARTFMVSILALENEKLGLHSSSDIQAHIDELFAGHR